jgi:hypothetical protein
VTNARQLTAALPARAHSERLVLAVVDLLATDPVIAAPTWCGDPPRVYRVPEATLYPDRPRPMITVAPDFKTLPLRLQGETESELRVLVTLFYDEPRVTLEPGDRGAASVLHHVWRVLTGTREARALMVSRFADRPLVQRPPRTADLTLAEVVEVLDDGTPVVHRQPQLQITYAYTLSRDTGQPEGFTDDD